MEQVPNKRVVHVSSAHPWTDNRIHYRECASLSANGYDVSLVAVETPVSGPSVGVDVTVIPPMGRLKRMTLAGAIAVSRGLKTRAHIFHLHDPELTWFIPFLRLRGKTVIYDAHEDLPEQVRSKSYLGPISRPFAVALAHVMVAFSKSANHVIAATETIAERYRAGAVTVVHNYPPLREEESSPTPITERPLDAVYIGTMGIARGARVMAEAVAADDFPEGWRLVIAGSMTADLAAELEQLPSWQDVSFLGQLPPDAARDVLLGARVGLVLFSDTAAHRDSLPTKMFEYFAAGVPVIASDFPLWRTIVSDRECGVVVDQTDPEAVARAVRRYAEDPELLARHSENARRLAVEELNWSREADALLGAYSRLREFASRRTSAAPSGGGE